MSKGNIFLKSFIGVFIGNFIACAILMVTKHEDYMRFWNYMGIFVFTFIDFVIFIIFFRIYGIISKISKLNLVPNKDFIVFTSLFGFLYTLGYFYLIIPYINKIGKFFKPPMIYFTDPGIPYFFFPLILFLFILIIYKFKSKRTGIFPPNR